jgi:hypothetical protein
MSQLGRAHRIECPIAIEIQPDRFGCYRVVASSSTPHTIVKVGRRRTASHLSLRLPHFVIVPGAADSIGKAEPGKYNRERFSTALSGYTPGEVPAARFRQGSRIISLTAAFQSVDRRTRVPLGDRHFDS